MALKGNLSRRSFVEGGAAVAALTALTACGGSSDSTSGGSSSSSSSSSSEASYNVCYLVNGNLGDKSFFDSAETGLETLRDDGVITLTTIEMGGTEEDEPQWLSNLYEVADSGEYDVIIVGTFQMPDYLQEVAEAYTEQKFIIFDDNTYAGVDSNVLNLMYKQNDLGYLVGTLAGSLTTYTDLDKINDSAVVGFVGGEDSPVINDFLYGFLYGAQQVNADIKVDTRYTGSYVDTALAKEYALSMINDNGCDIIWGVAGNSGNGAAEACEESGAAWFIGVDSDQEETLTDDLAAITLTSGLKNVGNSLIWVFEELQAGNEYWGQEVTLGLEDGGVGIVTDKNYDTYIPDDIKEAVEAAQTAVMDGSVTVPSALDDNDGAMSLRDSMQP